MTQDVHQRARQLASETWIEPLAVADAQWLHAHLEGCAPCARFAAALECGIGALRAAPVQADAALVEATQRSARLYAEHVRETRSRMRWLAVSCVLSVIWGGASLPYLWRGFAWLGGAFSLPAAAWQVGFVLFWLLPGVLAALVWLAPQSAARWNREEARR